MKKALFMVLTLVSILFVSCGDEVAAPGVNLHHIFPQQFKNDFLEKGIDIDKFTIPLDQKSHKNLHFNPVNWNNEWKDYLIKNQTASQKDLYNKAEKMLSASGGRGEFKFYDFNKRQVSHVALAGSTSLVCMGESGFWRFFGGIGRWVIQLFGGFKFGAMLISFFASIGCAIVGIFGIKVSHPVAVGIGFVACIIGLFAFIGICYLIVLLVNWIIAVLVPLLVAGIGSTVNAIIGAVAGNSGNY
jgi:hypothetical protein